MKTYIVTLPPGGEVEKSLFGLGKFLAGESRELELEEAQVGSLKAKGFDVQNKQIRQPRAAVSKEA